MPRPRGRFTQHHDERQRSEGESTPVSIQGKVWVYGDNVDTDAIIPARYLNMSTPEELAMHCMEDLDASFLGRIGAGDMIVAGRDFGCGSSREHAVWALRGAGIGCVIADSFARIFFRNAVNNGFPVVECAGIADMVQNGDDLEVDLTAGVVNNRTRGTEASFIPLPDFAFEIAEAGGLLPWIKRAVK